MSLTWKPWEPRSNGNCDCSSRQLFVSLSALKGGAGRGDYGNSGLNDSTPLLYQEGQYMTPRFIFSLNFCYVFTNMPFHIIECDLPASGRGTGSVCFQCIQEEAELDSGTRCVPVGGVLCNHTHYSLGRATRSEGGGPEDVELAP